MIIYPAIGLKDGHCVCLAKGDMASPTVYNEDPVEQARLFEKAGFKWLHLVDLNGAIEGRSVNAMTVNDILHGISIPVQLGGGIRNMKAIDRWFTAGVSRVILGTAAVRDPKLVKEACAKYPGRIAVSIDARGGKVAVSGWVESAAVNVTELAKQFSDTGVSTIIYTDIDRDGSGAGPNIEAASSLAAVVPVPVIASGGVGDLSHVKAAKDAELHGLIVDRAFYDGSIDLRDSLKV
jgi:phosphoribosylformimino-5-aminoimidazole carboxamide ribotide isomerase